VHQEVRVLSAEKAILEREAASAFLSDDAKARVSVPDIHHAGDWGVGVIIVATIVAPVFCLGDIRHFHENAVIELSQCVLISAACLLFLAAAIQASDRLSVLSLGWLSLFNLLVLVREVEFQGTPLDAWLAGPIDKDLDYVVVGILAFVLFLFSFRRLGALARAMVGWMLKGPGRLMVAGIASYLLGEVGDKGLLPSNDDVNLIFEESFELFGTLFFFVCAYTTLRLRRAFAPAIPLRKP
jgi:hypothetical protein